MGIRRVLYTNFVGNLIAPGVLGVIFVNMTNVKYPIGIVPGLLVLVLLMMWIARDRRLCLRMIYGSQVTMFMQYLPIVQFAVGLFGVFVFEALLNRDFVARGFGENIRLANLVVFGLTIQCGIMMGGIAYVIGDRWKRVFGPNQSPK